MNKSKPLSLIPAQVSNLFRDDDNHAYSKCLPFVCGDSDWTVPPEPEDGEEGADAAIGLAFDRGSRYAAAYAIYVLRNGPTGLPLGAIAEAMALDNKSRATQQQFWHYLTRLLWIYGHEVSAVQIAVDVEAQIEEANQIADEDLASRTADKEGAA
jgi:hypothetical protein